MTQAEGRTIVQVDQATRDRAIQRLVSGGAASHADRFLAFADANQIRLDLMWACRDDAGVILATVLAVPNPGRTAMVFMSAPGSAAGVYDLSLVVREACRGLAAEELELAQALLDPQDVWQREALLAGGFQSLAHLSYMERRLSRPVAAPVWPTDVTIVPYDPSQQSAMLTILDESYEETRDCPGLRGLRRTENVLDGHIGTGEFDPTLWSILKVDDRASGALLLNPSPASDTIELVYIGLSRTVQGRGLGRQLLRHGLRQLQGRPERAMTLAVDEQNAPAIALYRREQFRRVLRRHALIFPLQSPVVSG